MDHQLTGQEVGSHRNVDVEKIAEIQLNKNEK